MNFRPRVLHKLWNRLVTESLMVMQFMHSLLISAKVAIKSGRRGIKLFRNSVKKCLQGPWKCSESMEGIFVTRSLNMDLTGFERQTNRLWTAFEPANCSKPRTISSRGAGSLSLTKRVFWASRRGAEGLKISALRNFRGRREKAPPHSLKSSKSSFFYEAKIKFLCSSAPLCETQNTLCVRLKIPPLRET